MSYIDLLLVGIIPIQSFYVCKLLILKTLFFVCSIFVVA